MLYDSICFSAEKKEKSLSTSEIQSNNDCSPLCLSDMINTKVPRRIINKIEYLCLQIGFAKTIYV